MRKTDYIYITFLSVITFLLILLVLRPSPKSFEPKNYSEVQCEFEYLDKTMGVGMAVGRVILGSKGKKADKARKAIADYENLMTKRLSEGWRVLPNEFSLLCFMR